MKQEGATEVTPFVVVLKHLSSVGDTGFEPVTLCVSRRESFLDNYTQLNVCITFVLPIYALYF